MSGSTTEHGFSLTADLRSMPMKCEAQPRLSEKVKRVLNNPASF